MSAGLPAGWLQPAFASPRVRALMSARDGGVSAAPFDTLNLRDGLGDAAEAVARNRVRLQQALGMPSVMLRQVHGVQVVDLAPGMPAGPLRAERTQQNVLHATGPPLSGGSGDRRARQSRPAGARRAKPSCVSAPTELQRRESAS